MLTKKKAISLILIVLFVFAFLMVALRYFNGETSASAKGMKVKVLRRQDQLRVKPTAAEIADPRNRVQDGPVTTPKEERELDVRIPKHLPIRIKIKKEKEAKFKDLNNEHWARDLEVEVTNIGEKDIYFLSLGLFAPEIKAGDGKDISFSLYYGREELANLPAKAKPDDVPIKPRETFVFKLLENNVLGYEAFNRRLKRPLPKKVILRFRMLNFGDGTGFMGWDGTFFPRSPGEITSACSDPPSRDNPRISGGLSSQRPRGDSKRTDITSLPASFLPVNFFSEPPSTLSTKPNPQTCCAGAECLQSKRWTLFICLNCGPSDGLNGALCNDPLATCWQPTYTSRDCINPESGEVFLCPEVDVVPCGSTPTPAPLPSPSLSPTPEHCPLNCTDALADFPADPCDTANNIPGTNCPLGYFQTGNCCYATCQVPTSPQPECPSGLAATWGWPYDCEWHCPPSPPGGGGGGSEEPPGGNGTCTNWYWVLYEYDEVLGWVQIGSWLAGCF